MGYKELLSWMSDLPSYVPGLGLRKAAEMIGRRPEEIYPLNSNENLFIDREFMKRLILEVVEEYDPRLYPREEVDELVKAIAKYVGVKEEMVYIGCGSDQLIDLITLMLRHAAVAYVNPTFSMYRIRARAHRANLLEFQFEEDFKMPIEDILTKKKEIGVFFFCSPNNPTGHLISEEEVKALLEGLDGIIVSDEAYSEIAGSTYIRLIEKYDNLVVFRSFSKSFGMAGLRLGYIVANEDIIRLFKKVQYPYPVASLSMKLAIKALSNVRRFEEFWREAKEVVEWFLKEMEGIDVKVTPTRTIFATISSKLKQDFLFMELLKRGYLTRKIPPFAGFREPLRITLAKKEVMTGFIDALLKIL